MRNGRNVTSEKKKPPVKEEFPSFEELEREWQRICKNKKKK